MMINDPERARSCQRLVARMGNKDTEQTQQNQKKESDINWIVSQAKKLGSLQPFERRGQPRYADVTSVPEYQAACQMVIDAERAFSALSADVRKKFRNDPAEMIEFLSKEENREEAEKLGLMQARKKAEGDTRDGDSGSDKKSGEAKGAGGAQG